MKKIIFILLLSFAFAANAEDSSAPAQSSAPASAASTTGAAADPAAPCIKADDLMTYLQDMISLHRQIMTLEPPNDNSRQILASDNLRASSVKTINYAFDFGRTQSAVIDLKPVPVYGPVMEDTKRQNLKKISQAVDDHVKQVQTDLETINTQINSASGDKRNQLIATREKMNSELKLTKAQQDLIQSVLGVSSNGVDDVGVLKKINTLAKSVPEIQTEQQRKNPKAEAAPAPAAPKVAVQTSKGIIGLGADLYSSFSMQRQVRSVAKQNDKMKAETAELFNKLRAKLKAEIKLGDEIAKAAPTDGDNSLDAQKKKLEGLVTEFKLLGMSVIPLNQTTSWLEVENKNLDEWDDLATQRMHELLHILAVRLAMLAVAIVIPVILSRVSHQAINKYTKDPRWQRQLQTIRKVVFSLIIAVIIILNLISESGSILTFAGFLTAGLAVALQNVILSTVAYFFFFGRYGVREGDKVSVGVVTGEVIKIGIVRLYLMELAGTNTSFYPTGRIVTFPNSVLFQPAAFTKLIPGVTFTWNEVRVILDPQTDYELAKTKLMAVVEEIYEEYKDKMKQQQQALQRATNLFVEIPGPTGQIKFVEAGLAFVVRYPVQINDTAEIHDKITKKLIEAVRNDPGLKLA